MAAMKAEHVLVVSLRKSGTHLLKEVLAGLGYVLLGAVSSADAQPRPLGRQGALRALGAVYTPDEISQIKRSSDRAAIDLAVSRAVIVLNRAWADRLGMPRTAATDVDPEIDRLTARELSRQSGYRFSDTPGGVCWFTHDLDLGRADENFLLEWARTGTPRIILNYRDPRDVLLSMVNFLVEADTRRLGGFPDHLVYSDILKSARQPSDRIDIALTDPGFPGSDSFERALWLLRHPRVCKVSFEALIGPDGGGSAAAQSTEINRIVDFLGMADDINTASRHALASRIFNRTSHTFRTGQIGAWREHFTPNHQALVEHRYGYLLRLYGYQ
ncbi:sulfotransferase domain-containing protein [Nocardia amamiensis]|uniref:Sulfotransferase domain-containing protein n=1 Tax=Nocardia amamiensis TaxID=404578 RepID=A0ABS0D259_9NOCA|nr:sulfotransferase domain-containing protein [Nocardia amamiensis]MBF6302925.1 sulfotransferase domain-containing protein [Nocardia amamiensis]